MPYDRDELARRLAADEWLRLGEVAALARVARTTLNDWLLKDQYKLRHSKTLGGQRRFHPDDVRGLIDKLTELHDK